MKLFTRRMIFTILTIKGMIFASYFLMSREWFLVLIAALFSFVAAYNIICRGK